MICLIFKFQYCWNVIEKNVWDIYLNDKKFDKKIKKIVFQKNKKYCKNIILYIINKKMKFYESIFYEISLFILPIILLFILYFYRVDFS